MLAHDKRMIGDDRVQLTVLRVTPPPKISPYGKNVQSFSLIAASIKQVFQEVIVAPGE